MLKSFHWKKGLRRRKGGDDENAEKAEAKLDVEALTRLAVSQSEALQIRLKNPEA